MRIISGEFKGRKLNPPKNLPVRPTTDMAKEALFNILNNHYYFDEISILDLFAGTGSISFEFASRGVEDITSVDNNYNCIRYIDEVSDMLSLGIKTQKMEVMGFIERCNRQFDIIFADPPYAIDLQEFKSLVLSIFKSDLLSENGMLVIEHSKKTDLMDMENFKRSKNYGGCVFSFFEHN